LHGTPPQDSRRLPPPRLARQARAPRARPARRSGRDCRRIPPGPCAPHDRPPTPLPSARHRAATPTRCRRSPRQARRATTRTCSTATPRQATQACARGQTATRVCAAPTGAGVAALRHQPASRGGEGWPVPRSRLPCRVTRPARVLPGPGGACTPQRRAVTQRVVLPIRERHLPAVTEPPDRGSSLVVFPPAPVVPNAKAERRGGCVPRPLQRQVRQQPSYVFGRTGLNQPFLLNVSLQSRAMISGSEQTVICEANSQWFSPVRLL